MTKQCHQHFFETNVQIFSYLRSQEKMFNFSLGASKNLVGPEHPRPSACHCPGLHVCILTILKGDKSN